MIDIFIGFTLTALGAIFFVFFVFLGTSVFILALFFSIIGTIGWFLLANIVEVIVISILVVITQFSFLAYDIFKYFKLKSFWHLRGYHLTTYVKENRKFSKYFAFRLIIIALVIYSAHFAYYKNHTPTKSQINDVENILIKEI